MSQLTGFSRRPQAILAGRGGRENGCNSTPALLVLMKTPSIKIGPVSPGRTEILQVLPCELPGNGVGERGMR